MKNLLLFFALLLITSSLSAAIRLDVLPVPGEKAVKVFMSQLETQDLSLIVVDQFGRILIEKKINKASNYACKLNLTKLEEGRYKLIVTNNREAIEKAVLVGKKIALPIDTENSTSCLETMQIPFAPWRFLADKKTVLTAC